MKSLLSLLAVLFLAVLVAPVAWGYEVISTRGNIEDLGGIFEADGAEWKDGEPVPALPPSVANDPCPASIVIYVHGFQNTEDDANSNFMQAETALMAQGYEGTVIGFSWDSDVGSLDFDTAREAANLNGKVLAGVIKRMKQRCPDMKINLMSHSLGARVILTALECGGCADTVQLIAPAVDNEVLQEDEEFGADEITENAGDDLKIWYNDEDDILGGTYPLEEGDSALGSAGTEDADCLPDGASQCNAEPKMKKSAINGGKSPNPDSPNTDAEDDHSGYLYCSELMKCIAKRLK